MRLSTKADKVVHYLGKNLSIINQAFLQKDSIQKFQVQYFREKFTYEMSKFCEKLVRNKLKFDGKIFDEARKKVSPTFRLRK